MRLRVVTPIITRGLRDIADLKRLGSPDLTIEHTLIDQGPASIEGFSDEALAAPAVIAAAVQAERDGCDALLIDCFGDPGLDGAREQVRIPVLGPGETSLHVAAMLGERIALISVLDSVRPLLTNMVRRHGLAGRLCAMRMVEMAVLDLHAGMAQLQQAMAAQAVAAVREDGAEVIVLGCTGFHGCAGCVAEALAAAGCEVPVIDPIPITVQMARGLVAAGLRHSKRSWATPTRKAIEGYPGLQRALG
jgi:allantoin racemase